MSFVTISLPAAANTSLKTIFELVFSARDEIFSKSRICLRDKETTGKRKRQLYSRSSQARQLKKTGKQKKVPTLTSKRLTSLNERRIQHQEFPCVNASQLHEL
jgi:hypothetical protein